MSKFIHIIENILLVATAIICLLISLGDLFDVLHIFDNRIPTLTLLVLSISLGIFIANQRRCTDMHNDIVEMYNDIAKMSNTIVEIRNDIAHILAKDQLKHLSTIVEQIDPDIRKVLNDDYFHTVFDFIQEAVNEHKVQINNEVRFFHHFIRTLESCPRATFLSTSTSPLICIYKDAHVEDAIKDFILRGGKIKQCFFLKNKQELAVPVVQALLTHLQNIGVQVYIAYDAMTPNELKKNVFVEARGKLGWEIHLSADGHVITSTLTTVTNGMTRIFEKLRKEEFHASV